MKRKCLGYPGHECPSLLDTSGFNQYRRVRCPSCSKKWRIHTKDQWRRDNLAYVGHYRKKALEGTGRIENTGRICRYCGKEIVEIYDRDDVIVGISYWRICRSEDCRRKRFQAISEINPEFEEFYGGGVEQKALGSKFAGGYVPRGKGADR